MRNLRMFFKIVILASILISALGFSIKDKGSLNKTEKAVSDFIKQHLSEIEPLYREAGLASWEASTTGKEEAYNKSAELQFKLEKIYTSKKDFQLLKGWKESGEVKEPIIKRQLELLYKAYLGNQIPEDLLKQIVDKETEVEKKFSRFRGVVEGKEVTMNDIAQVLRNFLSSEERQKYWEAQKQVGVEVENDLKEVVKLRNKAARQLGFPNYYNMSLTLSDQDEKELIALFDELDELTRESFIAAKKEIDEILAARYGIKPQEIMPWHYHDPFFQEAPSIYKVDIDKYYKGKDIVELSRKYYASIGLPIDDVIKRSDLYERKGKNPHAFTSDIDRKGDVRILVNIRPTEYWMGTTLHEFGHAVYDVYMGQKLPFILRRPAHSFTTEAIAMLFERMSSNAWWIQQMLDLNDDERKKIAEPVFNILRLEELVFSRWVQVMLRFEQEMYNNPDQDLNQVWWKLVKKYQMVNPPEGRDAPDYAAKIHFSVSPVYYHNYQLGELMASQVHHYIVTKILKQKDLKSATYIGNKEVGAYLTDKIFKPGRLYYWNEMIEKATGEKLTAKYFAQQFVD